MTASAGMGNECATQALDEQAGECPVIERRVHSRHHLAAVEADGSGKITWETPREAKPKGGWTKAALYP